MNAVEKLLQTLCPYGVEFRKLGEVGEFQNGRVMSKKNAIPGEVPVIAGGRQPAYYHNHANRIGETIAISSSGAYAGYVSYWNIPVFLSDSFSISPKKENLIPKYLFYWLQAKQDAIYATKSTGGIPHVYSKNLDNLPIPLPPLEVQREIVKILDTFTELNTELNTELKLRKKQYEYYRNWLLSFSDVDASKEGAEQRLRDKSYPKALKALLLSLCPYGVEFKAIKDIAMFRRGSFPQPYTRSKWYGGDNSMPFIQVIDVADTMKLNEKSKQSISKLAQPKSVFVPKGTVIVTLQGTIGKVAITQYDSYIDRTIAIFTSYRINIDKKYFAYMLYQKFAMEKMLARGATLKTITKEEFSDFKIPLPPLEVQREIVKILDTFTELNTELNTELKLRKKQYEYYRDKLLTFTPLIKEGE